MGSFGAAASCFFLWKHQSGCRRSSKRLTNLLAWIKAGFALLFPCLIENWKPLKSLDEGKLQSFGWSAARTKCRSDWCDSESLQRARFDRTFDKVYLFFCYWHSKKGGLRPGFNWGKVVDTRSLKLVTFHISLFYEHTAQHLVFWISLDTNVLTILVCGSEFPFQVNCSPHAVWP